MDQDVIKEILPSTTKWEGVPYVGCAVTIPVGSDSYPGTVVWVSDETVDHDYSVYNKETGGYDIIKVKLPKKIRIRECRSQGVRGHDNSFTENQKYFYYQIPGQELAAQEYSYRSRRKNYVAVGTPWRSSAAQAPSFGVRRYYRDPSF